MNRKTQQVLTAAVVLVSVTVLSFGIRQVRVSVHRARVAKKPVSNEAVSEEYSADEFVSSARNTQPQNQLDAPLEQDQQPTDSDTEEAMTDSQDAFAEAHDRDRPNPDDYKYDKKKHWDKSVDFKLKEYSKKIGDYKEKVEYVPTKLSETETLYTGKPGEFWYVRKLPNGETTKQQMQEIDGELQPVGETNVYPGQGGKGKSGGNEGK